VPACDARAVRKPRPTAVYIETGTRRVFACALDWPGWCRSGKDEERALDALAAYQPRYAPVAAEAGITFEPNVDRFDVVEHLPGSASTDFGVPGEIAGSDTEPLTRAQAERQVALVTASWAVFDRVAASAPPGLRKGPRGGGRDRDAIIEHVLGAEVIYARKMGLRLAQPALGDSAAVKEVRSTIANTLRLAREGTPPVAKGWPPRYAARRVAWHVLDHAWEIEDRTEP
jgi:hypothetical protein